MSLLKDTWDGCCQAGLNLGPVTDGWSTSFFCSPVCPLRRGHILWHMFLLKTSLTCFLVVSRNQRKLNRSRLLVSMPISYLLKWNMWKLPSTISLLQTAAEKPSGICNSHKTTSLSPNSKGAFLSSLFWFFTLWLFWFTLAALVGVVARWRLFSL